MANLLQSMVKLRRATPLFRKERPYGSRDQSEMALIAKDALLDMLYMCAKFHSFYHQRHNFSTYLLDYFAASDLVTRQPNCVFFSLENETSCFSQNTIQKCEKKPPFSQCFRARRACAHSSLQASGENFG